MTQSVKHPEFHAWRESLFATLGTTPGEVKRYDGADGVQAAFRWTVKVRIRPANMHKFTAAGWREVAPTRCGMWTLIYLLEPKGSPQ